MIRTLLVDDEPLARSGLRLRLEREPDIEIAGEAEDGPSAVAAIAALRPRLVFLDVQMPGMSGFQVLEALPAGELPMVVFVTAHDQHALQAFEINALDYLLKPYSEERFAESLRRARNALAEPDDRPTQARLREMLAQLEAKRARPEAFPPRFAVRESGRVVLVKASELVAVEAAANYVMLVTGRERHLLRLTMAEMEQQLDPVAFARIHRSTIVRIERIREVRVDAHGSGEVLLDDGRTYRMSRAYRDVVLPRAAPPPG